MKSGRTLIVDDENNIRLMLRTTLETEGYQIAEATNGREALDAVERQRPDVVLLDLSMPEMDGLEFLKTLKGMKIQTPPRVIVLTAYGSISTAVRATRLGAIDFLEKPVSPTDVREAIEGAILEPAPTGAAAPDELAGGYEAVLERVRNSLRMSKFTDAESLLMKAADLGHKDAAYFNLLGVLYETQGKIRLARKFYGKAIAADKEYAPAQQNMRRLYELQRFARCRDPIMLGDEPETWFAWMPAK